MNPQLVDYIRAQLKSGYALGAIKSYLTSQGYPSADVEQAVIDMERQNEQALINYIQQQLSQSLGEGAIRDNLLKLGYPLVDITHAFTTLGLKKTSNKKLVLVYSLVALVLVGSGLVLLVRGTSLTKAISLTAELSSPDTIPQGNKLEFGIGFASDFDGTAVYMIKNYDTGELLTYKSESFSSGPEERKRSSIDIPNDASPGKYQLSIDATEGELKASSSLIFNIKQKEILQEEEEQPEAEPEEDQVEEQQPEEQPGEASEQPVQEMPEPEFPVRNTTELQDIASNITELASANNVNQAVKTCKQQTKEILKDACFAQLAKSMNDPRLCEEIGGSAEKDQCYWGYIVKNKDYATCGKIMGGGLRDSCFSLEKTTPNLSDISLVGALA